MVKFVKTTRLGLPSLSFWPRMSNLARASQKAVVKFPRAQPARREGKAKTRKQETIFFASLQALSTKYQPYPMMVAALNSSKSEKRWSVPQNLMGTAFTISRAFLQPLSGTRHARQPPSIHQSSISPLSSLL